MKMKKFFKNTSSKLWFFDDKWKDFFELSKKPMNFDNWIHIHQIHSFCFKQCNWVRHDTYKGRAINTQCKSWVVPDCAMMSKRVKDTPVQSQVERDKTVATNESGSERSSEGWDSRGAD